MAFVLGMLNLWQDAIDMALRSNQILGVIEKSEVAFFIAFARRRVAMALEPSSALDELAIGYNDILKAVGDGPNDPRYLKEQAAIALLYQKAKRRIEGMVVISGEVMGVHEAKDLLIRALNFARDDVRIRVEILNNLAYAEVLSDEFSYQKATEYLKQVRQIMDELGERSSIVRERMGPHLKDTEIMVDARQALEAEDEERLSRCVVNLNELKSASQLMAAEEEIINSHLKQVQEWRQSLTRVNQ